jgi:hypothetical protein
MSAVAGQGLLEDLVTGSLAGDDFFDGAVDPMSTVSNP